MFYDTEKLPNLFFSEKKIVEPSYATYSTGRGTDVKKYFILLPFI